MKAICLTYDPNERVMEFVLHSYQKYWPSHPFNFRVPYNTRLPDRLLQRFPGKIDLIKTAAPIRKTIKSLTQDLEDHEWVWWCLDDKYLTGVRIEEIESIYRLVLQITDPDVWGVMVTNNPYCSPCTVTSIFGETKDSFLRKNTYHGFFQPHFIRVEALRHFILNEIKVGS